MIRLNNLHVYYKFSRTYSVWTVHFNMTTPWCLVIMPHLFEIKTSANTRFTDVAAQTIYYIVPELVSYGPISRSGTLWLVYYNYHWPGSRQVPWSFTRFTWTALHIGNAAERGGRNTTFTHTLMFHNMIMSYSRLPNLYVSNRALLFN